MDVQTAGFALAAGMVATVNPCGFAMLPAYLALAILGEGQERTKVAAVWRALGATGLMACGFLVVFAAFGLLVAPLGSSVQQYMPGVTVVIGIAMIALGAWMLAGKEITVLIPKPGKGAPTAKLGSLFGYGLAYAIVSLSCTVGPFLAVTSATFRSGSVVGGVLAYVMYGMGMTLVVGVLAVSVALARSVVINGFRRVLPYANRIGGGLVVLVGLYVGYYGVYELRLYHGDGSAADPIVDGVSILQQLLVRWVDQIGPVAMGVALAVLVVVAIAFGRRSRGRVEASSADVPEPSSSAGSEVP